MTLLRIYKKLPVSFRNQINFLRHRINSNRTILFVVSRFRHGMTLRRMGKVENPIFLRIGESGYFPGWLSTNYQVFCKNFLDGTRPFSFNPGARYVVLDNVIEHLPLEVGKRMLRNIYESLIPGGVLRIATPHLRNISKTYLEPKPNKFADFREDFLKHGIDVNYPPDLLRATFNHFGHQHGYIYDFETLEELLGEIGFTAIEEFLPGKSKDSNLVGVENRQSKSDSWGQLCIEAQKPLSRFGNGTK